MPGDEENDYLRAYTKDGSSKRLTTDVTLDSLSGNAANDLSFELLGPETDTAQSVTANLSQGYCVGLAANGNIISADPDDYASDDAAIQAVNDWLAGRTVPGGNIYIPAAHPSKTEWVIENTVVVGDPAESSRIRCNLFFVGYPYQVDATGHMTTTIDDGSQMFRVVGDTVGGSATRGFTWRGGTFNLGSNDAGLVRFEYVTNVDLAYEWLKDFQGDGVVFDSFAFEPVFRRCRFKPDDGQATPTANCIVFENSYGTAAPAQAMIGEGVNTDGTHNVSILYRDPMPSAYIAGKYEGAAGRATIDVDDPGGPSCVFVTPKAHIGDTRDGAHGVYFDAYKCVIAPSYVTQISGDGIVVDGVTSGWVSPYISYNAVTGDAINVSDPGATNRLVVPREFTVGERDVDTVNYPADGWLGIIYPDGWQKFRTGSDTITANTTQVVETFGRASTGTRHYAEWSFDAAPAGDVDIDMRIGYDVGDGHPSLIFENLSGNDADISWTLYTKDYPAGQ